MIIGNVVARERVTRVQMSVPAVADLSANRYHVFCEGKLLAEENKSLSVLNELVLCLIALLLKVVESVQVKTKG